MSTQKSVNRNIGKFAYRCNTKPLLKVSILAIAVNTKLVKGDNYRCEFTLLCMLACLQLYTSGPVVQAC